MARVSGSIPNLANGVSQQASALRLTSQAELQVNCHSTVVQGLIKRPPTLRVASLGTDIGSTVHTHLINRDQEERYSVVMSSTAIRVFDLFDGAEHTVDFPNGLSYLSHSDPVKPPYRTLTIGDYTFVTNTQKTVAMGSSQTDAANSDGLVHVAAGNYGRDYSITIDGTVVARYRTPDGTNGAQSPAVDTGYIARRLATGETQTLETTVNGAANGGWVWRTSDTSLADNGITAGNGWTVTVIKSTIYIKKDNGDEWSIGVEDGYNGHAMKAIKDRVQDFSDLPQYAEEGMVVEVTGSITTVFDNYYVKFQKHNPADPLSTPGVWREVPQPGHLTALDPSTMPHVLVRNSDDTFTFREAEWDERRAGNDATVPGPSFVGSTITDTTFFKNRLGFISGENVILSRDGSYFDFFRTTATSLLDDDPIDVASTIKNVSILRTVVGFDNKLILFADNQQFELAGEGVLTPKTVSIEPTTAYSAHRGVSPIVSGDSVFFASSRGQFSMIREYQPKVDTATKRAPDITGHVPQYIPGDVVRMAASTHEDVLLVQSEGDLASLYVYKYYWSGDQKLQASWSKWTFPGVSEILAFDFINSQLVVVLRRDNQVLIESLKIQPGSTDDYADFVVHLDQRFLVDGSEEVAPVYDAFADTTVVSVPVNMVEEDYVCVTAGDASGAVPGLEVDILSKTSTTVTLRGDQRGLPLYFGTLYEKRYSLSTIYIRRESPGGGLTAVTEGRLQLLHLILQYSKTAFFRVEVTPLARETRSYVNNGRLMGDPENIVGVVTLGTGSAKFPILSRNDRVNIDIVNDSYLPSAILAGEWVGRYEQRSTRV